MSGAKSKTNFSIWSVNRLSSNGFSACFSDARSSSHEIDHNPGEFRPLLFLQEMTGIANFRVWLISASRHLRSKDLLAATRDRIAIAESGQKWLVPGFEYLPRGAVGSCCGVIWRHRHQARKCAGHRFVCARRKWGIVGADDFR